LWPIKYLRLSVRFSLYPIYPDGTAPYWLEVLRLTWSLKNTTLSPTVIHDPWYLVRVGSLADVDCHEPRWYNVASASGPGSAAGAARDYFPHCSWEDNSWRGAGVGDESTESSEVELSNALRLPLVVRPVRRTSVVVGRWTDELLCRGYKWVSRLETPCIDTRWTSVGWVEQGARPHGTACWRKSSGMMMMMVV